MTLLLLGGTGIALEIARDLDRSGLDFALSVAGGGRGLMAEGLPLRSGGFGGEEGFRAFLAEANIRAVLDATHPFAARISERTARVCGDMNLPYALAQRPAWVPERGDRWTMIAREEDAAQHIEPGSTVFLATGRQTLERFANLSGCALICRQIDPPGGAFPFENGRYLVGTPPFSVEDEVALFRDLGVDWLIVKNAGGAASATKLTAARELGLRVAMIARPPRPDAYLAMTPQEAVTWVREQ